MTLVLIVSYIITIVCLLVVIAFYTVFERKLMASIQRRRGPNVVGFWGLLQGLADGLKLALKTDLKPNRAENLLFIFAPFLTFVLALTSWSFIPFGYDSILIHSPLSLLYLLAISSIAVYGILLAGWASNSRYAFIGAMRSTSQMVSYEVAFGLLILPVALLARSFDLVAIVAAQDKMSGWFIVPLFPSFILFTILILAETNRTPFDLPEAEAELVAGYNVEYSSLSFALFFLGEYANMLLMSALTAILFLGGWSDGSFLFILKIMSIASFFIVIRATLPRYRFDQLMAIGWKSILPLALGLFVFWM